MAFLTIAGITVPVAVATSSATQKAPTLIGTDSRAYDGTLRTTVRQVKRIWTFTTPPVLQSLMDSIVAATQDGTFVAVGGDAIGSTINCRVTLGDCTYVFVFGGFRRVMAITATEA